METPVSFVDLEPVRLARERLRNAPVSRPSALGEVLISDVPFPISPFPISRLLC